MLILEWSSLLNSAKVCKVEVPNFCLLWLYNFKKEYATKIEICPPLL